MNPWNEPADQSDEWWRAYGEDVVCVACGHAHAEDDDCTFTCECGEAVPMAETVLGVDCGRGSRSCVDCTRAWVGQIYYYDTEDDHE